MGASSSSRASGAHDVWVTGAAGPAGTAAAGSPGAAAPATGAPAGCSCFDLHPAKRVAQAAIPIGNARDNAALRNTLRIALIDQSSFSAITSRLPPPPACSPELDASE